MYICTNVCMYLQCTLGRFTYNFMYCIELFTPKTLLINKIIVVLRTWLDTMLCRDSAEVTKYSSFLILCEDQLQCLLRYLERHRKQSLMPSKSNYETVSYSSPIESLSSSPRRTVQGLRKLGTIVAEEGTCIVKTMSSRLEEIVTP